MEVKRFNIRVYGIFINARKEILLAEETRFGMFMRKFPGGGLKLGEGIAECLQREWQEETGTKLSAWKHFYTTEFFQPSFFNPQEQIISIYYLVKPRKSEFFSMEKKLKLIFYPVKELSEADFTFPIDKKVFMKLQKEIPF